MGKDGNAKHGRNKRKPCNQRYTAEMRWVSNKQKKKARNRRRIEKMQARRRDRHAKLMSRNNNND